MDLLHLLHLLHLLLASTALRCSAVDIVTVVDFCGQTIQGDGMIVNSHQESLKYYFVDIGIDCHLTMQASSPKDKVQFYFRFFLVYSLLRVAPLSPAPLFPESSRGSVHLKPRQELTSGETSGDLCLAGPYIQFYDGPDKDSPTLGPPLCGKSPPRPVLSTGKYLTLRLVTRGTQPRVDFVGDFTSFRLGFNQSECSSDPYFTCRNGKCIPVSLVCDDKGLDNCGDGSDLEENLTTGCKAGQLLSPEPRLPVATPPPSFVSPTTVPTVTQMNCSIPDSTPSHEPIADMTPSLFLLILCSILGVVVGGVLFWCCWSPSWFLWHIGICRFMPCCNSACASCQFCQFCAHNCTHNKEHRMAKVSPHTPVNITLMGTSTTNSTEENITAVAV